MESFVVVVSGWLLFLLHSKIILGNSDNVNQQIQDFSSCNDNNNSSRMKMAFKDFSTFTDNNTHCSTIMTEFAQQMSDFVQCSILNARPFTVCENCLGFFNNMSGVYQDILSSVDNDSTTCEDRLMNSDKIQVIRQWNDAAQQLWSLSQCSACFTKSADSEGHTFYVLSNETLAFDEYMNKTLDCIRNQTGPPCDSCENKNVCEKCAKAYKELNKFYNSLADSADSLCMDIVDKMNMSRVMWSEHLLCVHHKNPILFLFISTAVVATLPVLFYFLAWYRSVRQEQCIVPQKRLLCVQGSYTSS